MAVISTLAQPVPLSNPVPASYCGLLGLATTLPCGARVQFTAHGSTEAGATCVVAVDDPSLRLLTSGRRAEAQAFDVELAQARAEMAARHASTSAWWHRPQGAVVPNREMMVSSMGHGVPSN